MTFMKDTSEAALTGVFNREDKFLGVKKRGAALGYEEIGNGARSRALALTATRPLMIPIRSLQANWLNYANGTDPTAVLSVVMQPGGAFQYSGILKKTGNNYTTGENICETVNGFEPFRSVRKPAVIVDTAGPVQRVSELVCSGYNSAVHVISAETLGQAPFVPLAAGINIGDVSYNMSGACYFRHDDVADDVAVLFPRKGLSSDGVKVAIFCHGAGDDYLSLLTAPSSALSTARLGRTAYNGLLDDGWLIVTNTGGAISNHWGSPQAWAAKLAVIDMIKTQFNVAKMVVIGQSMGGTDSLRALASIKEITNWFGIYPVCSVASMQGGYAAGITAAYAASGGYAANAAACDPMLMPAGLFAGKRLMCTASPADTTVAKVDNADALVAKVAGQAAVNTVIATTGNHGDASNWTAGIVTQMLAHLNG